MFSERYDAHVLDNERPRPDRQAIHGRVEVGQFVERQTEFPPERSEVRAEHGLLQEMGRHHGQRNSINNTCINGLILTDCAFLSLIRTSDTVTSQGQHRHSVLV